MARKYFVAIYEIDMAYGGPEEGGWYFGTGNLERIVGQFASKSKAYKYCRRANARLDHIAEKNGVREVSSVLYSGGRYNATIFDGVPPKFYPEQRPHYE